jgi:predicted RNA-binding protein with PIN domain
MPYLIDGHNLIGQMRGLRLDDPDDEAKLVERLKGFMMRKRKRCTVIFDAGLPGGPSRALSTSDVTVIFAPHGTPADALLLRRIRDARDPGKWWVVSGDQQIVQVAQRRRMKVIAPRAFAAELEAPPMPDDDDPNPHLSPEDVEEWLNLFRKGKDEKS